MEDIKAAQDQDDWCKNKFQKLLDGIELEFRVIDSVLKFKDRIYVSSRSELKQRILVKAYNSIYTINL